MGKIPISGGLWRHWLADMEKIVIFSFDDGTIWDRQLVELLNQYGIPGTFNLNSGLEDFAWEFAGKPVIRQRLADTVSQYQGHEIASHSLTHPRLDLLPPPALRREVAEDCRTLKRIFEVEELGFGVPFTFCNEREIRILKKYVRYIRLSEFADDFGLPRDEYHIPIHALYNDPDIREKLKRFAQSDAETSLFVIAGHAYELEYLNHWTRFEQLLRELKTMDVTFMTTMEFVRRYYPRESTAVCGK